MARAGLTTSVFVNGESGVGKSRLLAELASAARALDVTVLTGTAVDDGEETPYWPLRDALYRLLSDSANGWALRAVREWSRELAHVLPGVGGLAQDEILNRADRQPMLDVLFRVVLALAECGPMTVLLDDMHWADRSSRSLLAHLLATLTDVPVLFVISYRTKGPNAGGAMHDLALELQRSRRASVMSVRPLDRAAVAELMTPEEGHLVDLVWRRSGGNAYFAQELIAAMRDAPAGASSLPESLRDIIRSRLQSIPEAARSVVRALAVGEEPVPHQLLATVQEVPESDLLLALRTTVEAGLVSVDSGRGGYRLSHGLMREVVSSDLLPGESLYLNRRFAEALEPLNSTDVRSAGVLARHWLGAENWQKSFASSMAAAEDAERAFGFAEAQEHWIRALTLFDRVQVEPATRRTLQERAARAAFLAGDYEVGMTMLRQRLAEKSDMSETDRARLYGQLGQYLAAAGQAGEAVKAHALAVSLLTDKAAPQVQATVLTGHAEALENVGLYREGHHQAATALAIAEANGLPALQARILPTLGFCLAYLGEPEPAVAAVTDGLRAALSSGQPDVIASAHVRLAELLSGPLNRLEAGIKAGHEGAQAISDLGLSRTYGVTLQSVLANALFRMGEWSTADQVVQVALAARPTGTAALGLRLARCRLLVGQGHLDAAERELDLVQAVGTEAVGPRYQVSSLTLRAGIDMWRHRPDLAREHVALGLDIAATGSEDVWVIAPLVWHGLHAEADLAEAARFHSRPVDTAIVAQLRKRMHGLFEAASAAQGVRTSLVGYLQLCDGEATRAQGASDPRTWGTAAATWDANLHPYPAAYAHFREAEALFYKGARATGAGDALTSAYLTASRMGALPLLDEIATLAKHASVELPAIDTAPATPPDDPSVAQVTHPSTADLPADRTVLANLTARELVVLDEIAKGRSNQQIARRLFISEKTVSAHVSHILTKLGVRSRVQAAMLSQGHDVRHS